MMSLFSARRIWITTLLRWDLFREGIVERRMHQRNNLSGSLAITSTVHIKESCGRAGKA